MTIQRGDESHIEDCPNCGGLGRRGHLEMANVVHYRGEGFTFTVENVCGTCSGTGLLRFVPVDLATLTRSETR